MDTIDNKGREYEWCYNFVYDVKNRIERIEGEITRHVVNPNNKKIYRKYLSFTTNYCFKKSDVLDIVYIARVEYPEYTAWNTDVKYTFAGVFNADGTLLRFGPFDCEYMGGSLHKAYFENTEAISDGIARVNTARCIGCGMCAKECPKNIISMIPQEAATVV